MSIIPNVIRGIAERECTPRAFMTAPCPRHLFSVRGPR